MSLKIFSVSNLKQTAASWYKDLKWKLEVASFDHKERLLGFFNLRNRFFVAKRNGKLDKAMRDWAEFSGAVVAFGEADGFAKITTMVGEGFNSDLDEGWEYNPPHKHLLVDEKTLAFFNLNSEDDRKLIDGSLDELQNLRENRESEKLYYVVEAKAGLVALGARHGVRHGFHTRIVSPSLGLAVNLTKYYWKKESELSEKKQKADEDKKGKDKGSLKTFKLAEAVRNVTWAFDVDLEEKEVNEKLLNSLSARNFKSIHTSIKDLEEDLKTLKALTAPKLKLLSPIFNSYEKKRQSDRLLKIANRKDKLSEKESGKERLNYFISMDELMESFKEQDKLFEAMLQEATEVLNNSKTVTSTTKK